MYIKYNTFCSNFSCIQNVFGLFLYHLSWWNPKMQPLSKLHLHISFPVWKQEFLFLHLLFFLLHIMSNYGQQLLKKMKNKIWWKIIFAKMWLKGCMLNCMLLLKAYSNRVLNRETWFCVDSMYFGIKA